MCCCCSVVSDSLQSHGLQHTSLPCPSLSPGVCSDSCPLSQWLHPTISSCAIPFSSCLQSFPASGSFPVSWLFKSGGRSIEASASASVLPMNIHGWFPLGLTSWIYLLSKGLSGVFSSTTVWKHQFFGTQPSLWSSCHIRTSHISTCYECIPQLNYWGIICIYVCLYIYKYFIVNILVCILYK